MKSMASFQIFGLLLIFLPVLVVPQTVFNCGDKNCAANEECKLITVPCSATPCPQEHKCVATSTTTKPGICPSYPFSNSRQECVDDSGCNGAKKCCRIGRGLNCLDPILPAKLVKPSTSCKTDADCSPGAECRLVETACTGGRCATEAKCFYKKPNSQYCKNGKDILRMDFHRKTCSNNNDCPRNSFCDFRLQDVAATCCPNPTPTPVPITIKKPGICPDIPFGTCIQKCVDDGGCSGGQKCCSNGCGTVCLDPVLPAEPVKPSTMCKTDADCSANAECRSVEIACTGGRCPLETKCFVRQSGSDYCQKGKVILGIDFHDKSCDSNNDCPRNTYCDTGLQDVGAVCCSNPIAEMTTASPGSCPKKSFSVFSCFFTLNCVKDDDCHGSRKCCYTERCNKKVCQEPTTHTKKCDFFSILLGRCNSRGTTKCNFLAFVFGQC